MLHASRLQPKPGSPTPTIAGQSSGKRILCSHQALPVYNGLVKLARQGNHWAGLIVRGIEGLSSGRLDKNNIYIDERKSLAYGKGAFYIVLPGVTATLDEHPNGCYILQHIKVDTNYQRMQEDSARPGLWRINESPDTKPSFQADGKILKKDVRPVVITGTVKDDIAEVAKSTREGLQKHDSMKSFVNWSGFDMHFTPGSGDIIGLKRARDALATSKDREIMQSAILLANTMYKARNQEGVIWYSDWSGSAILVRAMQILYQEKGIKLSDHEIFLNRPTTRPKEALDLAAKLEIAPHTEGRNIGGRLKEYIGHIDITDISSKGLWESTKFTAGATAAVATVAGLTGVIPAAAGAAGAMIFVSGTVKKMTKNFSGQKYK